MVRSISPTMLATSLYIQATTAPDRPLVQKEELPAAATLSDDGRTARRFTGLRAGARRLSVRGYGQFCPIAKAAEIFAERWTPLILRELLCGSRRFSELRRGVPLMSRTLLAQRLRQLEDAGIVRSSAKVKGRGREYVLTAAEI